KTTDALEKYFETHHHRTCEGVAKMYGLEYLSAHNIADLNASLEKLFANTNCSILEVFTPRLENDSVLKGFFTFIKEHTAK
ncbi:MAG: 2-succinyl-5-enolpyruvyl-6-hydroxy-3-cyclohexene-1-carboxylate synthase, partial [Flavobacteriales bacterium]